MRRRRRGRTEEDGHRLVANRLHAAKIGEKPHIAKKNSKVGCIINCNTGYICNQPKKLERLCIDGNDERIRGLLHCKKAALHWRRLSKTRSYAAQYKNRLLGQGVISESVDHALRFDLPLMRKFARNQEGLSEDS